jgi:hypothetical protein
LRTGPLREVWLPPEKHRSSHTALPAIVAPAASMRVTTVASRSGTWPWRIFDPFAIGTPATLMLSFTATVRPASGPPARLVMPVMTYQAPSEFSAGAGHCHDLVGGTGTRSAYSRRTAS